jgi:Mg/Co/Ni transporter MgtE
VLKVRDVMTIGVPVCREAETCGEVAARLERQREPAEVIVVLDGYGRACGWMARERLIRSDPTTAVGEVADEEIPTVPPDWPAEAALRHMQARGLDHLLLLHHWPGEPRPAAYVWRRTLEERLRDEAQTAKGQIGAL